MESAATLTSAKVDLLPHQVVLVHRVANAAPSAFLVADEVGWVRPSRPRSSFVNCFPGRADPGHMIVPAGLVENWRRELNEVFNLDFEVFGSEGMLPTEKPTPLPNTIA
jgi:hypothetical protein